MLSTLICRRPGFESSFNNLESELNRLLTRNRGEQADTALTDVYPVDVHEDEGHIYVDAELPGYRKEEVSITLENNLLTFTAERKPEPVKNGIHLNERRFTRVSRTFAVPSTLDENKVEARLDNGILHITLHKREDIRPRKIEIK